MKVSRSAVLFFFILLPIAWFTLSSVFGLRLVPAVPDEAVAYLKAACEESGNGRIKGRWPIQVDGYLISRSSTPGVDPFSRADLFRDWGFQYMEFSQEALGRTSYPLPRDDLSKPKPMLHLDSPFIRVTLEEAGHPACAAWQVKARRFKNLIPGEQCLAVHKLSSASELWSRYEYRTYLESETVNTKTVRWVIQEVVDRVAGEVAVSLRMYNVCMSEYQTSLTRGVTGCEGHSSLTPQWFMCPESPLLQREYGDAMESRVLISKQPI